MNEAFKLFHLDTVQPIGGGVSLPERLLLYTLVRVIKPDSLLEIGVSKGRSTSWIAAAFKDMKKKARFVSIDDWSRASGGKSDSPDFAQGRLKEAGLDGYSEIVSANSHEWLPKQPRNSFDIVWVDGDHSYEGARSDVLEALRIAKVLVIVHDTRSLPDVRRACEDIEGGTFIEGERGFWIAKPR